MGYTPVHLAAERGYKDILELLINYGGHTAFREKAKPDDPLPPPETTADEPLRLAVKNGHYQCSELLLKRGANPNAKYFQGSEINFVDPITQVSWQFALSTVHTNVCPCRDWVQVGLSLFRASFSIYFCVMALTPIVLIAVAGRR